MYPPGGLVGGGSPTTSVTAHNANHTEPRELRKEAWRSRWFASDFTWQVKWQIWHHNIGLHVEWLSLRALLLAHVFGETNTAEPKALISVYL